MALSDLKFKHWFGVKGGKINFQYKAAFENQKAAFEGKRGYIVFYDEMESQDITSGDRGYYFGVVIGEIKHHSSFYGMSPSDIHHELFKSILGEIIIISGEEELWWPRLSSLNRREFYDYVKKVEILAGDIFGISIKSINKYQLGKSPRYDKGFDIKQ